MTVKIEFEVTVEVKIKKVKCEDKEITHETKDGGYVPPPTGGDG